MSGAGTQKGTTSSGKNGMDAITAGIGKLKTQGGNQCQKADNAIVNATTDAASAKLKEARATKPVCEPRSFQHLPQIKKGSSLNCLVYNAESFEGQAENDANLATALVRTQADVLIYQELRIDKDDTYGIEYSTQREAVDAICEHLNNNIRRISTNSKAAWKMVIFTESFFKPSTEDPTKGKWIRGVGILTNGLQVTIDPNSMMPYTGEDGVEYVKCNIDWKGKTFCFYSVYNSGRSESVKFANIKNFLEKEAKYFAGGAIIPIWCGDLNLPKDEYGDKLASLNFRDCLKKDWITYGANDSNSKIDYVLVRRKRHPGQSKVFHKDTQHVICHKPQFPQCKDETHALIPFDVDYMIETTPSHKGFCESTICSYGCTQ